MTNTENTAPAAPALPAWVSALTDAACEGCGRDLDDVLVPVRSASDRADLRVYRLISQLTECGACEVESARAVVAEARRHDATSSWLARHGVTVADLPRIRAEHDAMMARGGRLNAT